MKMADKIELWPVAKLKPFAKNSRAHDEKQIAEIAASISEFGFTAPILIDAQAGVLAGHGRLEAAKQLGLEHVPVIVLGHLSELQRRAYVIADNRIALNSTWNEEVLEEELALIMAEGFDMGAVGLSDEEIEDIEKMLAESIEEDGGEDLDDDGEESEEEEEEEGDQPILKNEIKKIGLTYDSKTHAIVSSLLKCGMIEFSVDNNADVVLRLLQEKYGHTLPKK